MTLGCSWTWGVGAAYQPGMSEAEYKKIAWDEVGEQYTFRNILSNQYNCQNINLAAPGSSNQKQMRLAAEYFLYDSDNAQQYNAVRSPNWPEFTTVEALPKHILEECQQHQLIDFVPKIKPDYVIWALTSVARNEIWDETTGRYHEFFYHYKDRFSKFWLKNIYNLDQQVQQLSHQVMLWNNYFKQNNIKVIWVDTFNIHKYFPNTISGLIRPNDLMAGMIAQYSQNEIADDTYHSSNWSDADSKRIRLAKHLRLVNPISFHPTAKGHTAIANFLAPYFEKLLEE